MDRFSGMNVFVKAVELGSFSAAAEALNMSPQLVGKHVQFLEHHLGVRLLNRTTRRQHLTEVGSQFYERSRNILAEVEAAEALAAETRAVPRGKLRVNAQVLGAGRIETFQVLDQAAEQQQLLFDRDVFVQPLTLTPWTGRSCATTPHRSCWPLPAT